MRNAANEPHEEPMGMTDEAKEEIQIVLSFLKSTLTKNHISMATDSKGNIYFIDTDAYVLQNKKSGFSVNINDLVKQKVRQNMTLDEQISFCEEKSKNIKLKAEPQTFVDIKNSLEKLKELRGGEND